MSFGVVVLAAGGSSRMGRTKQLLPYLGHTLVAHAVRVALKSGADEVVVVVGAEAEVVREALQGLPVRVVVNREWEAGMGGSIACGIAALGEVEAAVVTLADQPKVTAEHLHELAVRQITGGSPIVASSYDGVLGAPTAFGRALFDHLRSLRGETGARALIRDGGFAVDSVVFADGNEDIDTPEDYRFLVPPPNEPELRDPESRPQEARAPPAANL